MRKVGVSQKEIRSMDKGKDHAERDRRTAPLSGEPAARNG